MDYKSEYLKLKRELMQEVNRRILELKEWVLANCVTKEELRQLKQELAAVKQELLELRSQTERALKPSLN